MPQSSPEPAGDRRPRGRTGDGVHGNASDGAAPAAPAGRIGREPVGAVAGDRAPGSASIGP